MNELKELQEYLFKYQYNSIKCDMDIFKAGIYFLYKDYKVVYVGQAQILAERLARHYKDDTKEFDQVRYINLPIEHLNDIERAFIKLYNPVLNKRDCNSYGTKWALKNAIKLINE